jgi:hypothetical protein
MGHPEVGLGGAGEGFGVEEVADGAVGGGGGVGFVVVEVGLRRDAVGRIEVQAGRVGAGAGGVGEAVLRGVGDDLVEEWAPVGECDSDAGVAGAGVRWNTTDFGVELRAGGGEGGDLRGEQGDEEAAGSEGVEGVDFGFEVGAGVAVGGAEVVEAAGEEEHGGCGVEVDVAGVEEVGELVDLIFHAEAEDGVGALVDAGVGAGFGGADAKVEGLVGGVGVAVVGEGDAKALGQVGDGGGAVGVEEACAGIGVAVAEDIELSVRGGDERTGEGGFAGSLSGARREGLGGKGDGEEEKGESERGSDHGLRKRITPR